MQKSRDFSFFIFMVCPQIIRTVIFSVYNGQVILSAIKLIKNSLDCTGLQGSLHIWFASPDPHFQNRDSSCFEFLSYCFLLYIYKDDLAAYLLFFCFQVFIEKPLVFNGLLKVTKHFGKQIQ